MSTVSGPAGNGAYVEGEAHVEQEAGRADAFAPQPWLLESVLQSMGHGVVVVDRSWRLLHFNKCAEDILGLTAADLTIDDILKHHVLLREDGVTPVSLAERPLSVALRGEAVDGMEVCLRRRDSSHPRWLNVTARPLIGADGTLIGKVFVFNSLDSRKEQEITLIRARDIALESARLKSEFLANMSHEIRTPLSAITGMTELLLDTKLTGEQREFADTIAKSAGALLVVVNDILDFSKMSAGKLKLEKAEFSPTELVETVVAMCAERAQTKGLELASYVDGRVPLCVIGDSGRLRQVLTNLVSNAVKFTSRGEVVVLVSREGDEGDQVTLHFTVRDTGIGIAPEAQSTLFRPFAQVDSSTTRKYGGTGLGLAISAKIIEAMGGTIGVESAPGEGSSFWFTVPLRKQAPAPGAVARSLGQVAAVRALVIDGNPASARTLCDQLISWGMSGATAANGTEALAALKAAARHGAPFTVAIIDGHLPDLDGVALCRAIQEDTELRGVSTIATYPLGNRPDEVLMSKSAITAWLAKPVRQSQLFDCLSTMLGAPDGGAMTREDQRPARSSAGAGTPFESRVPEETRSRARILVVEDHAVNRRVILRMLKRLGYMADAVENGLQAVSALTRSPYDVVLMDCRMPELDGYEATRRIRQAGGRFARIPIVGVTAHALNGDREKCLAAGMDEYLSKPIVAQDLALALEKWLLPANGKTGNAPPDREPSPLPRTAEPGRAQGADPASSCKAPPDPAPAQYPPSEGEPIDMKALFALRSIEDDEGNFLVNLIDIFLADMTERLETMKGALERGDADTVKRTAHALKGSCGHFGATKLAELCKAMEQQAQSGTLTGNSAGVCRDLAAESARVRRALEEQKSLVSPKS